MTQEEMQAVIAEHEKSADEPEPPEDVTGFTTRIAGNNTVH